jgi:hypothetical protein
MGTESCDSVPVSARASIVFVDRFYSAYHNLPYFGGGGLQFNSLLQGIRGSIPELIV